MYGRTEEPRPSLEAERSSDLEKIATFTLAASRENLVLRVKPCHFPTQMSVSACECKRRYPSLHACWGVKVSGEEQHGGQMHRIATGAHLSPKLSEANCGGQTSVGKAIRARSAMLLCSSVSAEVGDDSSAGFI